MGQNTSVANGTYRCNQTFNNTQTWNTRWRWGNTTYYFSVNLTDGLIWVNETFSFVTDHSRYDITTSGDVVATDVAVTWSRRTGQSPYYGIYDVDGSADIVATDISLIWANRT